MGRISRSWQLVKASWARTYDPVIGIEARKAKSDLKHVPQLFLSEIRNKDAACMIAELDGEIIGHVGGQLRGDRVFFVDHLHVAPVYHGKGVASGLMKGFAEKVRQIADCIELTVLSNNHRAFRFYEKLGFVEATGSNEDAGLGGVPSVLMRWSLK